MTDQELRNTIAEAEGHAKDWWCPRCQCWVEPRHVTFTELHDDPNCSSDVWRSPEYVEDLNAIQHAVLCQSIGFQRAFNNELKKKASSDKIWIHALNAREWCECFLELKEVKDLL